MIVIVFILWEIFYCDFVGLFFRLKFVFEYIFILMDDFICFVIVWLLCVVIVYIIINILDRLFFILGLFCVLYLDNGFVFIVKDFVLFCECWSVK